MPESASAAHFLWTQPQVVWRQLLRPWLEACARTGWEGTGAPASSPMLLAPDAGMIAWIKGRAVAEGIGCLGVHFHTAGTLRSLLAQAYGVEGRLALREDLHLLMGQAARSLPDNPVAQAAVLDPAALTRLCDRIDRAGWRSEGFSTAAGRQLANRYFEMLAAQGLRTVADLERELLERAERTAVPACGYLLAAGFGCEHSDSLLLLRAAALSARQPIFCLDTADTSGAALTTAAGLAWQSACEEYFGLPQILAQDPEEQQSADSGEDFADSATDTIATDTAVADTTGANVPAASVAEEAQPAPLAKTDVPPAVTLPAASTPPTAKPAAFSGADSLFEWAASQESNLSAAAAEGDVAAPQALPRHAAPRAAAALAAWAEALATHSSMDPAWRRPLQQGLRLLTFRTLDEEAHHVVSLVSHWLAANAVSATAAAKAVVPQDQPSASVAAQPLRIGIVLAGGGSLLGREIAAGLSSLGIAHYDSLGHQPARSDAQRLLESWCSWQNSNQIDDFNAFVAELCRQNLLPPAYRQHWERAADKALSQTLCAELGVVAAWIGRPAATSAAEQGGEIVGDSGTAPIDGATDAADSALAEISGAAASADVAVAALHPSQQAVQEILANWPQLPEQASFADFWALAQPVLAGIGWPLRQEPLQERALAFGQTLGGRLPRSAFISWLRSVTRVPGRTRNALGHEPFARVHLVTLAEASRQQWSHLCVVGMVHGQWPPLEADSALLDPERCSELNRRAERPSRFGQGQSSIGGSHTFLGGARQQREAFDAAFVRLLGQTGLLQTALSRYRFEPGGEHSEAFASEYFLRAVYAASGSLESRETPVFCTPACHSPATSGIHSGGQTALGGSVAYPQIALAYLRRRDPAQGFDAYSYALSVPPAEPLHLSGSHWAEVLSRPAHAWYRYVLRVKKRRRASDSDFRHQSQGIWVHAWLNPTAERSFAEPPAFVPRPDAAQWREQVATRAAQVQRSVAAAYIRAGRQLPQWWQSDWSAAEAIAGGFALALGADVPATGAGKGGAGDASASLAGDSWDAVGGEWPLAPLRLDLPDHPLDGIMLEGIVDLLLAPALPPARQANGAVASQALWVVDFKTGADSSLSLKSWESKGAGLQLVLYALALRARGAGRVQMSILKKGAPLQPQLDLDDLSPQAEIWQKLMIPMHTGIFGQRGALRDAHAFNGDYPIATLGIDPVVLERKARLTEAAGLRS